MRQLKTGIALISIIAGGCVVPGGTDKVPGQRSSGTPVSATADVRDAAARSLAIALVTQSDAGLHVRLEAKGMSPGTYAVHLHPIGSCVPPTFDSAGKHWNPAGHQHGRDNPQGAHLGDLPNILIGTDGRGEMDYTIGGARLTGGPAPLLDADGGSILIHINADDYRTDPSGNSGTKIACGVFTS